MAENNNNVSIDIKTFVVPGAILLVGIMISGAIFFGLKGPKPSSIGEAGSAGGEALGEVAPPAGEEPVAQLGKTSIDDDPIMGDRDSAQVAIVEFSDYECSFCNRFRTDTLDQIKEDYIDTGKAILVFRDLPLPFHNPAAEREAMAAECAREQGGDGSYYQFHDQLFETTPGNGVGIDLDGLAKIAGDIGLSGSKLKSCIEGGKYKDEVAKDAVDAAKAGINGTPGFVIGKLAGDGSVEGVVISGAQPYPAFQSAIEDQLN